MIYIYIIHNIELHLLEYKFNIKLYFTTLISYLSRVLISLSILYKSLTQSVTMFVSFSLADCPQRDCCVVLNKKVGVSLIENILHNFGLELISAWI